MLAMSFPLIRTYKHTAQLRSSNTQHLHTAKFEELLALLSTVFSWTPELCVFWQMSLVLNISHFHTIFLCPFSGEMVCTIGGQISGLSDLLFKDRISLAISHNTRCINIRSNRQRNTELFISLSGISELACATTKTDTAERSISIGRESLQVFFLY